MPKTIPLPSSPKSLVVLSQLLLQNRGGNASESASTSAKIGVEKITRAEFDEMLALADANHVVVRAFDIALGILRNAGDEERAGWMSAALDKENARVQNAVSFLHRICDAFQEEGLNATVIKSLDHWPDLGSDLDMYTNAEPAKVIQLMTRRFQAQLAPRSWGDRLACKWNFVIPGLSESVEIHMGRLGQTGEQITLAERLPGRARQVQIDGRSFRVPHVSDRLMISTLQRMYRHFYFRLCDIVDSTEIAETGAIDFGDLQRSAAASGIWEGVATYLVIVSDYVEHYRGMGLDLPRSVTETARFGGEQIYFAKDFLRVPILPQSARLYGTQLGGLLRKGELQSSARLGLLPWLATAAAVGLKLTGSDKGIW
jgi:hypothetical protein